MGEISAANIARAEELLPCFVGHRLAVHVCRGDKHDEDCPAHYRPAVSQALQDKDDRIAELEKALEPFARSADMYDREPDTVAERASPEFIDATISDLRKARAALAAKENV
jgi:hypothetical protein